MDVMPVADTEPHGPARVLVVEDDPIVRDFCVRLLRLKGYYVLSAENGRVALETLRTQRCDLVLTDLQMPELGGIALLQEIRNYYSDLDVIVFTAYATVETARDALKLGAFDYLTKPVSVDDLERTVRRAIEWRNVQREKQRLSEIVALHELSKTFTSTLDTATAVHEIVRLLWRYFAPRALSLSLFHPEDDKLELLAQIGARVNRPAGTSIALPSGTDEQKMQLAHLDLTGEESNYTVTHLASLVLRTNDRPVGILRLMRTSDQPGFEPGERTLLTICASQIAASLDNSRLYRQQKEQYLQTIQAFAALIDARDPYTRGHSEQVMCYAVRMAEILDLHPQRIEHIRYAALLHDIGKIGIHDHILLKPGPLTDDEFAEMRTHPRIGADILRHIKALRHIIPMIEGHHERLDGRGYPSKLSGNQLSEEVRILSIADAYDTMTSDRAYRKALPIEQAFQELRRGRGTQWDADFVDIFITLIEREGPSLLIPPGRPAQYALPYRLEPLNASTLGLRE